MRSKSMKGEQTRWRESMVGLIADRARSTLSVLWSLTKTSKIIQFVFYLETNPLGRRQRKGFQERKRPSTIALHEGIR